MSDTDESDEEDDDTCDNTSIRVNNMSPETLALIFHVLEYHYKDDASNACPTPKKVTSPKFKIEEELGKNTVKFMEEAGKDAIFAIVNLADFLGIQLITHICYTWIAHMMNTLNTKEKMDYLGLEGPEPTFEDIMKVNLEKGEISPPIPKPDEDATTNAHNSDGGKKD